MVKGVNGQIDIIDDKVVITRKGLLAKSVGFFKGEIEIPISSITSVEFKMPSFGSGGYIQFIYPGCKKVLPHSDKAMDENTVLFNRNMANGFLSLKQELDRLISNSKCKNISEVFYDQIEKLACLRDKGILTEEEFQNKKSSILSKL